MFLYGLICYSLIHMRQNFISKALLWSVRSGIWLLLFTPLVVAPTWFFPYITGKNFFFRIVTEITFGFWLALIVVNPRFRPRSGFVLWAFLGFISILGFAAIFGADPYHSFWSNYERMEGVVTFLHLAALFLMASSVFHTVSDWRLTFHVSAAVSFIVATYGLLELIGVITIPGSTAGVSGIGIFSRLGNQIYLAAYLLFHFFILGFLFFTTRHIWRRAVYTFLGFFEFYIFLHTGTRGALIGLVAGFAAVVVALFLFSLRDNKRLAAYMGGVIVFGIAILVGFYMLRDSALVARYPLLHRFADIDIQSSTARSRLMIWGIAKEAFQERPFLGWGPENFIIPYAKYYNPNLYGNEPWFDRVHNMHLEWLVAAGIVGFLAYLLVIGSSLYGLWRLWRNHLTHSIAVAALVGFLAAYLAQNTFVFDNIITYLFFALFLALVQSLLWDKKENSDFLPNQQGATMAAASFCIIAGITLAAAMHAKQMRAAGGIITMLNAASTGRTVFDLTNKLDANVKEETFGVSEARERFVDIVFSAASKSEKVPKSDLLILLSRGIEEIKREVERNPENIRHLITLGKLYQLRSVVAESSADRDEAITVYERALAIAPRYPSTYIGLAEAYLVTGETHRASETLDSIFRQMTHPNTFIYSLLTVSILDNDFEKAINQVKRFRSLGNTAEFPPEAGFEPEKLENVIDYAMRNKDVQGRERFFDVIFEFQKYPDSLYLALVQTKADLGKFDEARRIALELVERDEKYRKELEQFFSSFSSSHESE